MVTSGRWLTWLGITLLEVPVDPMTPAPTALTAPAPTASVPPVTAPAGPALPAPIPTAPVDPVTPAPTATAELVSPAPTAQKYPGRFVHFVKKIGDGLSVPRGMFHPRIVLSYTVFQTANTYLNISISTCPIATDILLDANSGIHVARVSNQSATSSDGVL
jgi:hypothetical protein